ETRKGSSLFLYAEKRTMESVRRISWRKQLTYPKPNPADVERRRIEKFCEKARRQALTVWEQVWDRVSTLCPTRVLAFATNRGWTGDLLVRCGRAYEDKKRRTTKIRGYRMNT